MLRRGLYTPLPGAKEKSGLFVDYIEEHYSWYEDS
jgi:hypothetical protein